MKGNRLLSLHYLLRTIILLGFSSYIVFLTKTDALVYYLAPRMMIYAKVSAVALYVIACFQCYSALRIYQGKRVACDCEHPVPKSAVRNMLTYGVLVFPLLVGFCLPNAALGSAMASAKGMNLSIAKQERPKSGTSRPAALPAEAGTDAEIEQMFNDEWEKVNSKIGINLYKKDLIVVKPSLYKEILSTIDLFKNNFIGKKIEISGFVFREENMKSNEFIVGRFVINCCSADAAPYGAMIEFPAAQNYTKDTWVKVTGTIQSGSYNGKDIFKIKADQIEKIAVPDTPYLHANYDPLNELD
ncbi:TIGR03943 family putative permease subunit [Paenibacillus aceris]|uniref:Repeat protein (TIGR03943 family) n=1 Tax=Paenibacillus aceris TaxID=869555 RepID=A0ABS4I1Y7_9BACL|nr:TIGR03943 family protein [Paenibacillus aceris]MBP1964918.1 putative repeat protein (TIGR03943 family) [Paenibacillus aceris]NHW38165.1 TIGR03943 family protein [Paenibacillus aceris]